MLTSDATHAATVAAFEAAAWFGLGRAHVVFVRQASLPVLHPSGRFLLESRCAVATSPDGNGGLFEALQRSGALDVLRSAGVLYLHAVAVDNALCRPGDPELVGACAMFGSETASRCVRRAAPDEAVGVFARLPPPPPSSSSSTHDSDPKPTVLSVVEYSELPVAVRSGLRPDGRLAFDAANVAQHVFTLPLLSRLAAPPAQPMRYHAARKRVSGLADDSSTGAASSPAGDPPNPLSPPPSPDVAPRDALKLEAFIFDAFPHAEAATLLRGQRSALFAPVKNAEGRDSPARVFFPHSILPSVRMEIAVSFFLYVFFSLTFISPGHRARRGQRPPPTLGGGGGRGDRRRRAVRAVA